MVKIIFSDDEKKFLINEMQEKLQNEGRKVSKTKLKEALAGFINGECYWFEDHSLDRFEDWCKNVEEL